MNIKIKLGYTFIAVSIILLIIGFILLGVDFPEGGNSTINGYEYLQFYGVSYILDNSFDNSLVTGILLSIIIAPILLIGSLIWTTWCYIKKNK